MLRAPSPQVQASWLENTLESVTPRNDFHHFYKFNQSALADLNNVSCFSTFLHIENLRKFYFYTLCNNLNLFCIEQENEYGKKSFGRFFFRIKKKTYLIEL
jgi:hypothetical protein